MSANERQTPDRPEWTRSAKRVDQPNIDEWYKPERHRVLDGRLVWQGDRENHFKPGEVSRIYLIREAGTDIDVGVRERPAFASLRSAKQGARVCIIADNPKDVSDRKGGTFKSWDFEVFVDEAPMPEDPPPGSSPPF